jgi:hypothetical protein
VAAGAEKATVVSVWENSTLMAAGSGDLQ